MPAPGKSRPRGQSSLAVSTGDGRWSILNASPDIRGQFQANAQLHPKGLRQSPLCSVLLTNGDIDHIAGLLSLREQTPFAIYATREILNLLAENSIFNAVSNELVRRHPIRLEQGVKLQKGITARLFAVPARCRCFLKPELSTPL